MTKFVFKATRHGFLLFSFALGLLGSLQTQVQAQAQAQEATRIGIFGDIHGEREHAIRALRQMRERGVTHIIATGDFIAGKTEKLVEVVARMNDQEIAVLSREMGHSDIMMADSYVLVGADKQLEDILSLLSTESGVPRERIYLYPGNWEHEVAYTPEVMNAILRRYGQLVFENYDGHGFVTIGETKIMVSHFPQHQVPDQFLPPEQFRRRLSRRRANGEPNGEQTFVMDTVERGIYPSADVSFEVFAHTHIAGSFVDPRSGKVVINPGVLATRAKSPVEPLAYAIFDQGSQNLSFIDLETNKPMQTVSVNAHTEAPIVLNSCNSALTKP